jgi:dienelactone hydrolase
MAPIPLTPIDYTHAGTRMIGQLAHPTHVGKRPGILVVHEWWGCNDYAKRRASMLADLGYVALACDLYGEGRVAANKEQAVKWHDALQADVPTWLGRLHAALQALASQPGVDASRLGAIGYCLGGTSVLRLACDAQTSRDGASLKAVASFHGGLWPITIDEAKGARASLLICNGSADPFIPHEMRSHFMKTLDDTGADYQFVEYGRAVHGFTNPGPRPVTVPGVAHDAKADARSWRLMQTHFAEAFAG